MPPPKPKKPPPEPPAASTAADDATAIAIAREERALADRRCRDVAARATHAATSQRARDVDAECEELRARLAAASSSLARVGADLRARLEREDDALDDATARLARRASDLKALRVANEAALRDSRADAIAEETRLRDETAAFDASIADLETFAATRGALEDELGEKRALLSQRRVAHAARLEEIRLRASEELDAARKEHAKTFKAVKTNMKAWTDARLEEGTKRTIAENAQMRGELAYQSEHTNKMSVMDEQRGKSATKAATALSVARRVETEHASRNRAYARSAKTLRRKLAEQARQFELERALDDEKARELFETRNRARELERDLRAWDGASSATAAIAARLRSARDASPPPTRADAGMTERAYARLGGAQLGVASANEDGGGDGSLEEERERRATTREGGGGGGGGSGAGRGPAAAAASADGRAAAARAGAQRECAALLVRCAKDLEEDAGEDAGWRRDALARLARALTDGGGGGDDENQNLVDDQNQNQNQKSLRIGVHHANAVVWEPVQNDDHNDEAWRVLPPPPRTSPASPRSDYVPGAGATKTLDATAQTRAVGRWQERSLDASSSSSTRTPTAYSRDNDVFTDAGLKRATYRLSGRRRR